MAIAGLRGTGDWGTDERPKNFRELILFLKPNGNTPLTAMMSKMSKQSVNDPEFSWWEETLTIGRIQLNDGTDMSDSDTAFVVDNGVKGFTAQDLKPGDLLLVEEGVETTNYAYEIIEVSAVASATAFTGLRGRAGSSAAIILDDTFMTLIGSAYEEGSVKAAANTRNPIKFTNLCQIFKDTYFITKTLDKTFARTGNARQNDKKRKMFRHSTNMEQAWLYGKKAETTGGTGQPLRYTGGLLYFFGSLPAAADRRIDLGTAMVGASGINTFFDNVEDVFDYQGDGQSGGDERFCLIGNSAATAISKAAAAAGTVNFGDIVKVYGMRLTRLVTPQGELFFKTHPLMNVHPLYTGSMFILDPPAIKYRPLDGRDTKPEDNIQTPGQDAIEGQWLTEAGIELHHIETMKYLSAVTWAAS